MTRRRSGVAMIAAGALCLGGALAGAVGAKADTVELFSFTFTASARGYDAFEGDTPGSSPNGASQIPDTEVILQAGPVGFGFASLAWPGPLAGNAGALLPILCAQCPPSAAPYANSPSRAEARTGESKSEQTQVVGNSTLFARAIATEVEATGVVNGGSAAGESFGSANARSDVLNKDGVGTGTATSTVSDINIGSVGALPGAPSGLHIGSVTSVAIASTDGVKAKVLQVKTEVQNVTIAGQPAYIDESGIHAGSQGDGGQGGGAANMIANAALKDGYFKVAVSQPIIELNGPTASVTAGSVVITWGPPGAAFGVLLGGARTSVTASPGEVVPDLNSDLTDTSPSIDTTPVPSTDFAPASDTPAAVEAPPADAVPLLTGPGPAQRLGPIANQESAPGFGGVGVAWIFLGLLAVPFLTMGFKRVGDGAIEAPVSICNLE